ncbi:MAG: hypothetical protein WCA77_06020 [Thermoplasmata archaeon]
MALEKIEARVLSVLRDRGLLLFTDSHATSVVSLVTGAPAPGNWFTYPAASTIYAIGQRLEDSKELISVPLLRGKGTLVHRRLWPELFAMAASGEAWQEGGLSLPQKALLRLVRARRRVNVQQELRDLPLARGGTAGDLARSLERRLLVYGRSVHSPSGRHEKVLETWSALQKDRKIHVPSVALALARATLDEASAPYQNRSRTLRLLPWQVRSQAT